MRQRKEWERENTENISELSPLQQQTRKGALWNLGMKLKCSKAYFSTQRRIFSGSTDFQSLVSLQVIYHEPEAWTLPWSVCVCRTKTPQCDFLYPPKHPFPVSLTKQSTTILLRLLLTTCTTHTSARVTDGHMFYNYPQRESFSSDLIFSP